MEKTKRIKPKSLTNDMDAGSGLSPKWLRMIPTNRIHVDPMLTPLILNRPRKSPRAITIAKIKIDFPILPFVFKTDVNGDFFQADIDEIRLKILVYGRILVYESACCGLVAFGLDFKKFGSKRCDGALGFVV